MTVLSILLYRALIPTKLELSQVSKIRHYCVVVETVKLFVCLFVCLFFALSNGSCIYVSKMRSRIAETHTFCYKLHYNHVFTY